MRQGRKEWASRMVRPPIVHPSPQRRISFGYAVMEGDEYARWLVVQFEEIKSGTVSGEWVNAVADYMVKEAG